MRALVFFVLLFTIQLSAQEINQLDANGNRHGTWKKYFDGTQQLRYEGTFKNGKEVGLFKYYSTGSGKMPVATSLFKSGSDQAEVKFFSIKGSLISEGGMNGKSREGTWKFYQRDGKTLLSMETYGNGVLNGPFEVYYKNGKLSETFNYVAGKKHGPSKKYSEAEVLIHELEYKNDQLAGPAKYYNSKGEVVINGLYAANRKAGLWKYYTAGKLTKEMDYANWSRPITTEY